MQFLMYGVGVFDEQAGALVGSEVVAKEQTASDFRGVLRMLRESVGEKSHHKAVVSAKRSLQALLLMTLVNECDALSLVSPIVFFTPELFSISSFSCAMFSMVILLCIFISAFAMMPPQQIDALEPEPETETAIQTPVYNKAAVYCFFCLCVRRTLELIDDAEFDENHERVGSLHAIHEILMNTFEMFERDGITARNFGALMEMHGALQLHDAELNASNLMSVESGTDFTEPMEEPEIESLLPSDPPSDLHVEELGEPYAARSPEHMAMWLIQRVTERLARAVERGDARRALKHVEQRQVMVRICQLCEQSPDQRESIWRMMQTLSDLSSSDEET